MNLEGLARSRVKRAFDRLAWVWIASAPLVVVLGAWLGVVDLGGFPVLAADETAAVLGAAEREDQGFNLSSAGSGELLWKSTNGLVPLPTIDIDVRLEVTGMMVRGRIVQTFANPTDEVIEVIYVFPLPDRAAVRHMEMRIGPRRIVSIIQEREQAKKTYTKAKSEGRKAALVEQDRPNLFTTSAANINPGESIDVVLEYLQEADYADGEFSLSFPLTFTPRFTPPAPRQIDPEQGIVQASATSADAERVTPPFVPSTSIAFPRARLETRIQAGLPLEDVRCGSHDVETWWEGEALVVTPRQETIPADRDFRLTWRPQVGSEPRSALFVEERDDGRYALMMLLPPIDDPGSGRGLPTETLFIVDVSGSMDGPSIGQAREALLAALDRLRPEDTFNILRFSDHVTPFRDRLVPAYGSDLVEARAWVRNLRTEGGTVIHPALLAGLNMLKASDTDRVQRMIFLTDGAVSNEVQVFRSIVSQLGTIRLHTLGIGSAPNGYLMRKMAKLGRGICDFIADASAAGNRIDAFFARLDRPVMTDLSLRWDGVEPDEVYPSKLTDLHAGEPLFVSARLPSGSSGGRATLEGRLVGGNVEIGMAVDSPASAGSGVATRWARAKVESLMDTLHEGADAETVREAVIEVSIPFHIVTRYTSLVAVEEYTSAFDPAKPMQIANGLPNGSRMLGVLPQGGTYGPLLLLIGVALAATGTAVLLGVWKWS